MMLYSRKHFILGLLCVLVIIFEAKHYDGIKSALWIGFFAVMGFRCMCAAFSPAALEKEETLAACEKRVMEQMGLLWRIPMLVIVAPILLGAVAFSLLWPYEIANVLLFAGMIASLVLGLRFRVRYNELMEREKEKQENHEENES